MMGHRVVVVALLVAVTPALADVTPEQAAKAIELFKRAQAANDAGRLDEACQLFEDSVNLDPQIGPMLNLADCRERAGRRVDAHALFERAAALSEKIKDGREAYARQRITALASKLVRVVVRVAKSTPGLQVTVSGGVLERAAWGKPHLADPGTIVVEATASGRKPFHREERAVGGAELAVDVPELESLVGEQPPQPPQPPPPHDDTPKPARRGIGPVPFVVGGVGAAAVLVSVGIGLDAKSKWDTAFKASNRAGVTSAQNEANVGTGVAIVGGVALATGIVLYAVRARGRGVVVTPTGDRGTVGIAIAGAL